MEYEGKHERSGREVAEGNSIAQHTVRNDFWIHLFLATISRCVIVYSAVEDGDRF